MRTLMHTEFTALLARADVSQASFARLAGITARQVNNWARGHASVPQWAALLAVALKALTPEMLLVTLEEAEFGWHEVLGVPPNADASKLRQAMTQMALRYHPDKGGSPKHITRVNAAYEKAKQATSCSGQ